MDHRARAASPRYVEGVFGGSFRQTPRAGDIMMWIKHVGLVAAIRPEQNLFLVSQMGGSRRTAHG